MKKLLMAMVLFGSLAAFAQDAAPAEAAKGVQYGAGVSETESFKVYTPKTLAKALDRQPKLDEMVVQGRASGVCDKKGCWMTLANDENTTFFVKMKDYAFFLPKNILGKTVLVKGSAEKKTTSVAELRHYAEDAKQSKEAIAKITAPKTEIRLLASGIKVVD